MANGGLIAGSGLLNTGGTQITPDASWSIVAESDFSGDGRGDLVWRDTSGTTALWTMNGSVIASSSSFTSGRNSVNPDPTWSVAGAGDFNGDARSDILWRSDSGGMSEWLMKGTTILSSVTPTSGGNLVKPRSVPEHPGQADRLCVKGASGNFSNHSQTTDKVKRRRRAAFLSAFSGPALAYWPLTPETNVRFHVGERAQSGLVVLNLSFVESDPDVWTGCVSQVRLRKSEVADMYPACWSARGPWP